jgi:hypothetical protein
VGSMLCNFLVFCVVFFICLSALCALGFLSLECPFSNLRSVPVELSVLTESYRSFQSSTSSLHTVSG